MSFQLGNHHLKMLGLSKSVTTPYSPYSPPTSTGPSKAHLW